MDASSLNQQIRLYELRIVEYEEENKCLSKKNEKLDDAASQYKNKQQAMFNYRDNDKAHSYRLRALSQIRIAGSYAESLYTLATDHQSSGADEAFSSLMDELAKSKQNNNDKILSNNKSIEDLKQEIASLRYRLTVLA